MVLSDSAIRARLGGRESVVPGVLSRPISRIMIDPMPEDRCIQSASVDLTLSNEFLRFPRSGTLSAVAPPDLVRDDVPWDTLYVLEPGGFVLGCTVEKVQVPVDLIARVEGKSSLGRIGLMVHVTAGFIDPGFRGRITLELRNLNKLPIELHPGMRVSQIIFETVEGQVLRPYGTKGLGSKYQDSEGVRGPLGEMEEVP
jgi:dCTP deaminase